MGNTIRIVSVSGGKDSTALYLWALEQWGPEGFRAVFADTGHEHPTTYNYIKNLSSMARGPAVEVVSASFNSRIKKQFESEKANRSDSMNDRIARNRTALEQAGWTSGNTFLDMMIARGAIPRANRQFCTEELKMKPIRNWLEGFRRDSDDVHMYVGIRAGESEKRSKMPETEWNDFYGCDFHRPLLKWSEKDVFNFLEQHGIPPNPLYSVGNYKRVGCFPCIHITKSEIATLPDWVWEKLAHWELVMGDAWFVYKAGKTTPSLSEVQEWAKTTNGGKQFGLFAPESVDVPTCMSTWGVCE